MKEEFLKSLLCFFMVRLYLTDGSFLAEKGLNLRRIRKSEPNNSAWMKGSIDQDFEDSLKMHAFIVKEDDISKCLQEVSKFA